ncbi:MAG: Uncharacterised protein [Cryomorphaceae bacterium]|nr:MAG: Uncharacterised protein [Cryomorphaceae bacterium]
MNDFKIKLGAINGGENYFLFEIKDQFFEEFILSDVEHANIKATAFLDKEGDRLGLTLTIDGKINKLLCDICTDEISVDITAMTKVIIKTTDEDLVSTDEIFYVKTSENAIDLKQLIFELIILNLPKKRQHAFNEDGSSKCNKEMIDLVNKYTVTEEKSSDPRWDALKKLKIK